MPLNPKVLRDIYGDPEPLVNPFPDARKLTPDSAAKGLQVSRETGVDAILAADKLPDLQDERDQKYWDDLVKSSPKTARHLSNASPAVVAATQDNVDSLSAIERTFKGTLGDIGVTVGKGIVGLPQSIVGLADIATLGYTGKALDAAGLKFNETQRILDSLYSPAQQRANTEVRNAEGFFDTLGAAISNPSVIATTVGESLPQMLGGAAIARGILGIGAKTVALGPNLPGWLARTVGASAPLVAGAAGEGVIGAGSAAEQIRGDGTLSLGQAGAAAASGAGTGLLSLLGGKLAQKLGVADIDTALASGQLTQETVNKGLVRSLVEAGVSEGVFEELPQSAQEQIWQNIATDKPAFEGVANAAAMGLLAGAVTGGAFQGVQYIASRQFGKADQAEQSAAFIGTLNQLAAADKLLQRDADSFEQFVAAASEDGPVDTVYVDGRMLMQSGMSPKLAEMSPSVREQLDRAILTGGDIAIPVAEYMAKIAKTELAPQLQDHIRLGGAGFIDEFTATEAREWKANFGAEMQADVERILTGRQDADAFMASQDVVKQDILNQLNTTWQRGQTGDRPLSKDAWLNARSPEKVNEGYATIAAARTAVRAAAMGMTPEAFHQKYGMRVQGEAVAGDKFDQTGKLVIPSPEIPKKLSQKEFEGIIQDIDGFGPIDKSDIYRAEEFASIVKKLKSAGVDFVDMYHVTDADLNDFSDEGVRGSSVDYIGRSSEKARAASVYGFLDPDDIKKSYDGVLGAKSETPNVIHIKVPVDRIDDFRWDSNFNLTYGAYSGARFVGDIPTEWIAGAYRYDVSTGSVVSRDPADPNILNQPDGSGTNRGAFSPATNTVTLLKNADLSTFLHESAHYFFESDIQLASELLGKSELTPGEQQIVDDVSRLLTWHGIQGDVNEQIRTWHTMDFEEQRSHHERTAESFEAYLFSGKAPSLELQPVFQRFAQWMVNVYKSLKDFLAKNPEAGKLNDEVRQVFDRMIATREEIALAEQARSMMPLFSSPETSGMNPDEYAALQAQHKQATDTAVDELQAKGLRDLQWLKNAKGKQVARLKRESKALRAEVEIEARREVMSQPVYRAWDFLTGKAGVKTEAQTENEVEVSDWKQRRQESMDAARVNAKTEAWDNSDESKREYDSGRAKGMAKGQLLARQKKDIDLIVARAALDWDRANPRPEYTKDSNVFDTGEQVFGKFNRAALEDMGIPDEIVGHIRKLRMTAVDGMAPDLVATLFDFSSGDELVRTLASAQSPKEAITELADRLMLERHGELSTPEAIELAADAAIHNDMRARVVTTEYNALAQATGQRKLLNSAAKEYAAAIIARLKIRDIRPSQYANAETRAAKAAQKASGKGDLATAAAEKRNQVINIYATRAAYDAKDEVTQGLAYVKRRVTASTSQKNMRGESKAQLLALLDRFDLRKSVSAAELDRQQSLVEWAAGEAERLAAPAPILSDAVADEGKRTHYKNLTVEEFRGLIDSIKQLEHMARREHKAYLAIREMSLQEEVGKAVAEIREVYPEAFDDEGKAKLDTPLTHRYAPSFAKNLKEGLRHMNAEFVPMEELIGQLTAGKFGLLHESLFGRISGASDRKSIMAGEIRNRLSPAYDAYTMQEKRDFSRKMVGDTGMTKENILMLALYYGNVEGRQRLASQGFNDQQVLNMLRYLDGKDLNLAEAIWSLNDDYIWPQYAALNERTQGKAPPKVQAAPMQINGRDLKGGYVKLVYDSEFDETTRHRDSMADAMAMIGGRSNVSAKTNQGSSIERVKEISKMPLLELRAMSQAVNEHMHDISYREAVADTVRVLREPAMRNAIKAVSGKEVYSELLAKVNEVAARPADPSSVILKALNHARKHTIVVLMSGIKTALVNYSGLLPAMLRVNAGSLVKNVAKVHSWRMREMIQFAMDRSEYMRERNQQFTSDLQHEMASLTVKNRLLPEMGTFLILMRMVDQVTSTSVWLAAYEEGVKTYADEQQAIEYANSVTRGTQGAGRDVDTSKIMTRFGPWSKPFLMFYSFFNRQLGLLVRQGVISERLWNKGQHAKAVGLFTASYLAIIVIPALINDMAGGKCDDAFDGEEGFGRCISKAIAMNMAGFVPVLRDVAPYAWAKLDDSEPDWGLRSTALSAYFEGVIKGTASAVEVANDEGDEKDTKSIFMGLAFLFGLPGKLLWDTTAGTEAVINDDAPPQSALFGPPKY